jgi:cytoplasmic iron level regulating protein YaaA (DUF328/UPF0246 family)
MINILYDGKLLHENISVEESQEILLNLAEQYYDENIDPNKIQIEIIE